MTRRAHIQGSDLRGAARLATDATAGLADLVEALHAGVARIPVLQAAPADGRTRGITALVYRSVRGATRLVGGSIESLLGLLGQALDPAAVPAPGAVPEPRASSPEREAILAALNGVLGDYLAASANPLATPMAFRHAGRSLVLEPRALHAALPQAGSKVLVLIHGLCMNDLQWCRAGHDHGAALARDLGYCPVYLHYNSGQHVSINGHALAPLLERLVSQWPRPLEELVIVGHSMGGLLARSALHYAGQAALAWPQRLTRLVFLGTPHHGAPLERAGHWIDLLLGAAPYAAPFARLGKLRSAGITDLRHGNLLDEDWVGHDRFAGGADRRLPVPLPADVRCYALAATTGARDGDLKDRLLGDGLVPLASALGRHPQVQRRLHFAADHRWVGYRLNHLDLLSRPEVYDRMRRWLE